MIRSLDALDVAGKRVFVRVDFNVPIDKKTGAVKDDARIRAALPTIKHLIGKKAKIILASHLGRPDGKPVPEMSLDYVGERLSQLLSQDVLFADDCVGDGVRKLVSDMKEGQVVLLENLRFHAEEEKNDEEFSRKLAQLAEVYVDDAFGTVHRAHASTVGMVKHVPQRGAGYLVMAELKHLQPLLSGAKKPYLALLGGAKVSDKIKVIEQLMTRVDALLVGGAMAYTFLAAKGVGVGSSRVEKDKIDPPAGCWRRRIGRGADPAARPCRGAGAKGGGADEDRGRSIPDGWLGSTSAPRPPTGSSSASPPPRRCSGTGRWGSSRFASTRRALARWRMRSRRRPREGRRRWSAEATARRPSRRWGSPIA
jgi:phosphoglycerate kinase